jgi:hypothetical protein
MMELARSMEAQGLTCCIKDRDLLGKSWYINFLLSSNDCYCIRCDILAFGRIRTRTSEITLLVNLLVASALVIPVTDFVPYKSMYWCQFWNERFLYRYIWYRYHYNCQITINKKSLPVPVQNFLRIQSLIRAFESVIPICSQ